jgi:hypothetical protein
MIPLFMIVAIASVVPSLDMSAGCRPQSHALDQITDYKSCMQDEKETKEKLAKEWASYPTSARVDCLSDRRNLLNSYVELLTCIEMEAWRAELGALTAKGANGGAIGGAPGGSPPTPGQLGGSSLSHPLDGSPTVHVH